MVEFLEENIGKHVLDISLGNELLGMTSKVLATKAKVNKLDYLKLKSFCSAEETINEVKRPLTEREKTFANDISDKGLKSKI